MENTTYCILGGGGSFAINTAHYLLNSAPSARVVGVGRAPLRPEPFRLAIDAHRRYQYRQFHIGHELDMLLEYLDELRPHVIINFAAQGEGAASWKYSWRFFDTNATALARFYEVLGCRSYCKRFIHIGTSELYGAVNHPAREADPIRPSSPYSASKAAFDLHLMAIAQAGVPHVPFTILRPSNAYCEGQLLHRIIPRAIVAALLGRRVPLHGGGKARKSYLHIEDVARAIFAVAHSPVAVDRIYNVGPAAATAIVDVARMCSEAVGRSLEDVFDVAPERVGQDAQYWLDSFAIYNDTGWYPNVPWGQGLTRVANWAQANLDKLADWPTDYQLRA